MEEKEVMLDGKKIKVITKLPKEEIETNNNGSLFDDTIDLNEVIKVINDNE